MKDNILKQVNFDSVKKDKMKRNNMKYLSLKKR
jgi:hypothetical protein